MTDRHHEHEVDNPLHAVLKGLLRESKELHESIHHLHHKFTHLEETLLMALNEQAKAIVASIDASTNKIGAAVAAATQAITDLAAKVAAGSIDPADLQAAVTPLTDKLNAAADALTKTATDADPAINPGAPPIVVP